MDNAGFFGYIKERHLIYLKKTAGEPWPWTQDQILQTYSYCNVFRELDKVTIAFRKMLAEPYKDHPNLWFLYCMARQINWPETIAEILKKSDLPDAWNPEQVRKIMQDRKNRGEKLYTGAYLIRGDIQAGVPGSLDFNEKSGYTCFKVLDPVFVDFKSWQASDGAELPETIQGWTNWLSTHHGWGMFLSYEVATDLRHTRYLQNAPDIMTWANAGPGAVRGLNRYFGRHLWEHPSKEQTLDEMRMLLEISTEELEGTHVPALEMRDIEHSLCEFDKYERVRLGQGRPRAKYKPKLINGKSAALYLKVS
jgi:hypothetical protein